MNTDTLQRFSHVLFWASIILPTLGATLGAMAGVARFYVDRQEKRLSAERSAAALALVNAGLESSRADASELRSRLDTLKEYSEVARLNFVGTSGTAVAPLVEHTGISRALESAVEISGTRSQYRCDPKSLQTFREVIVRYPQFPFSHYALAFCLQRNGDTTWKQHATAAIEILKKTTTIDGHHSNHDQALQKLQKALAS
jgi:hypothetical protein